MSTVNSGPSISKTSLVLDLDASARRSFLPNSIINMNSWTVSTGSVAGYGLNGAYSENIRTLDTNPWGDTDVVWGSFPNGSGYDDGGWNGDAFNIDNTKMYRFSVWVRRISSTSGGSYYLGLYANGSGPVQMSDNVINTNPYWYCNGTSELVQNTWYLLVGHAYPYNTTYTGRHPDTGYYLANNPNQITLGYIGCNIGSGDVKWSSNTTQAQHRVYHYYCNDSTTRLQFYDPRVDLMDGKQPSIAELVKYSPTQFRNLASNSINFSISGKPTYSTTANGLFNFNGSNTYFTAAENSTFNTETFTIECWARTSNLTQNGFLFEKGNVNTQFSLFFENSGATNYFKLRTYTSVSGLSDTVFGATATYITSNVWFLISASYNYGVKKLYFNGVLIGTGTVSGTLGTNTNGMSIGVYGGQNGGRGYYYTGDIGSLRFYNRVLSDGEILQNFQQAKSKFGL